MSICVNQILHLVSASGNPELPLRREQFVLSPLRKKLFIKYNYGNLNTSISNFTLLEGDKHSSGRNFFLLCKQVSCRLAVAFFLHFFLALALTQRQAAAHAGCSASALTRTPSDTLTLRFYGRLTPPSRSSSDIFTRRTHTGRKSFFSPIEQQ